MEIWKFQRNSVPKTSNDFSKNLSKRKRIYCEQCQSQNDVEFEPPQANGSSDWAYRCVVCFWLKRPDSNKER